MATFRCNACGVDFETQEELDNHNRTAHKAGTPAGTPGGGNG